MGSLVQVAEIHVLRHHRRVCPHCGYNHEFPCGGSLSFGDVLRGFNKCGACGYPVRPALNALTKEERSLKK